MQLSQCFTIKNFSKKDFVTFLPHWQKTFTKYTITSSSPFQFREMVPNTTPISFDDVYLYKNSQAEIGAKFKLNGCLHEGFDFDVFILNGDLYIDRSPYYYGQYVATSLLREVQRQMMPDLHNNMQQPSYKDWSVSQARGGNVYAENNYRIDKEALSKLGIEI